MTKEEREKIIAHIRGYMRVERPQLFDDGPWLEHHVNMNWSLFERVKAERPTLTLEQYLAEEREKNPWTSS